MIQILETVLALITACILFQQTQAQNCNDPAWCATLDENTCNSHIHFKNSCKTLCGTCKDDIGCPDISPIAHGDIITISEPPYKVGTTANFTCDTGFRGTGVSSITCLNNGEWSDEIPSCTPSACVRDRSNLEKGRKCPRRCKKDGLCRNNFHTCQCDDWCGKSCFNIYTRCGQLSKPQNGEVNIRGRRYSQKVTYKCKLGYTLIGPRSRSCRSDRKWSGYDPFCIPFSACGFTDKQTEKTVRVVHGTDAKKGAWPWQVALIRSASYSVDQMYRNSAFGGGSVITDEWVLSAAHVFTETFSVNVKSKAWKDTFLLAFGMESFVQQGLDIPEHIQIFEPKRVILHSKFNPNNFDYDVALIRIGKKLKRGAKEKFIIDESDPGGKVTFSRFVRPVCLPCMKGSIISPVNVWKNFDKDRCHQKEKSIFPSFAATGSKVVVTGFGVINASTEEQTSNLQEGQIKIVDPVTCARDLQTIKLRADDVRYTDRMFCASGGSEQEKVDACQGDSGGPVVKKMRLSKNKLVKYWMQLGIVSWGLDCAAKHHGYYTSVPSIMNWVWKILDDDRKGVWGNWNEWGTCDVSCGTGQMKRTRICQGSKKCIGSSLETTQCNAKPCSGAWNKWSLWSQCSKICGFGGEKTRKRSCLGPEPCIGNEKEKVVCSTQICQWSQWSQWSECSASCGGGDAARTRSCQRQGECLGLNEEKLKCKTNSCPVPLPCEETPCHTKALCLPVGNDFRCQCRPGYEGDGMESCQRIFCGPPTHLTSVRYSEILDLANNTFAYLEKVTVKCNEWYEQTAGYATWKCNHNKTWIPDPRSVSVDGQDIPICRPTCGMKGPEDNSLVSQHISGGVKSMPHEWPWVVFLNFGRKNLDTYGSMCSGAVISPSHILTVADCVFTPYGRSQLPSHIHVWLGVPNRTVDESKVKYARVAEVITHPKYNKGGIRNFNVAVIKLIENIIMSDAIRPICLPSTREDFAMAQPGQIGEVAAWGLFDAGYQTSMHLLQGEFPIVTNQKCLSTYRRRALEMGKRFPPDLLITENMFCAGIDGGNQGTCQGDSGAPFVAQKRTSVYYEMGLVSFGLSQCGSTTSYTAFTKLNQEIVRWIMQNTNNLMEEEN